MLGVLLRMNRNDNSVSDKLKDSKADLFSVGKPLDFYLGFRSLSSDGSKTSLQLPQTSI